MLSSNSISPQVRHSCTVNLFTSHLRRVDIPYIPRPVALSVTEMFLLRTASNMDSLHIRLRDKNTIPTMGACCLSFREQVFCLPYFPLCHDILLKPRFSDELHLVVFFAYLRTVVVVRNHCANLVVSDDWQSCVVTTAAAVTNYDLLHNLSPL